MGEKQGVRKSGTQRNLLAAIAREDQRAVEVLLAKGAKMAPDQKKVDEVSVNAGFLRGIDMSLKVIYVLSMASAMAAVTGKIIYDYIQLGGGVVGGVVIALVAGRIALWFLSL